MAAGPWGSRMCTHTVHLSTHARDILLTGGLPPLPMQQMRQQQHQQQQLQQAKKLCCGIA